MSFERAAARFPERIIRVASPPSTLLRALADTTRRARATRRGSSAGASLLEGRDARGRASRDEHRVSETLGRDGTRAQIGSDTVREGMRRPRGGAAVRSLPDGGRRAVHRVHQRTDVVGFPRQVRPPRVPSRASRAGRTRATFRLGKRRWRPVFHTSSLLADPPAPPPHAGSASSRPTPESSPRRSRA